MDINYLSWYIELEQQLHHEKNAHVLMSSGISEPTDMILNHLKEFQEMAREYIDVSYAWGHEMLKDRIANKYGTSAANVTTTNGASNGIYLVCRALLQKDDHVIIETPCYEPLKASPAFIGARVSFIRRRPPDYGINIDELESLVEPNTKSIILSNLHNPSGALIDEQTLLKIAGVAKKKNPDIKIVIDEIYRDFLSDIPKPAALLDDCFVSLNSLTKVYGLGIVHCGWIIADTIIIDKIRKLQILVEGAYSRLLDSFSTFLIEHIDEYRNRSIKLISANFEVLSQYMQPLIDKEIIAGKLPKYGCIYFPHINCKIAVDELARRLMDDHSIYVVPGRFFDRPEHIRIGFGGQTDKLKYALDRLSKALIQCF